jgi:hypothetical protein
MYGLQSLREIGHLDMSPGGTAELSPGLSPISVNLIWKTSRFEKTLVFWISESLQKRHPEELTCLWQVKGGMNGVRVFKIERTEAGGSRPALDWSV